MNVNSKKEEFCERIMDHGIAHLVYQQNGIGDIIHPFSVDNYEILSDEFVSFMESYRPLIPEKGPIALEIIGESFTKEEKELIDWTIWYHFGISMERSNREVKKIWKTSILYFLFTVLSSILIFAFNSHFSEIVSNLAYVPFYFFGFRMLIYLLMDCVPVWKERRWYRRLASVKLIFSGKESISFESLDIDSVAEEFSRYEKEAEDLVHKDKIIMERLFEDGIAVLGCKVNSLEDVVQITRLPGREYLSDALISYLSPIEPYINGKTSVTLYISGAKFDEEEKDAINRAVENTYSVRMISERDSGKTNGKMTFIFGLFILLTSLVLVLGGKMSDIATHEFFIMLLWFFGDYFMEFILINQPQIVNSLKITEKLRDMKVIFE